VAWNRRDLARALFDKNAETSPIMTITIETGEFSQKGINPLELRDFNRMGTCFLADLEPYYDWGRGSLRVRSGKLGIGGPRTEFSPVGGHLRIAAGWL
jgi:hypothetical protein